MATGDQDKQTGFYPDFENWQEIDSAPYFHLRVWKLELSLARPPTPAFLGTAAGIAFGAMTVALAWKNAAIAVQPVPLILAIPVFWCILRYGDGRQRSSCKRSSKPIRDEKDEPS